MHKFKEYKYCGKIRAYKCSDMREPVAFISKKEASAYKKTKTSMRGLQVERIGNTFGVCWGFKDINNGFLLKEEA